MIIKEQFMINTVSKECNNPVQECTVQFQSLNLTEEDILGAFFGRGGKKGKPQQ
jgi:hypothetical protein